MEDVLELRFAVIPLVVVVATLEVVAACLQSVRLDLEVVGVVVAQLDVEAFKVEMVPVNLGLSEVELEDLVGTLEGAVMKAESNLAAH